MADFQTCPGCPRPRDCMTLMNCADGLASRPAPAPIADATFRAEIDDMLGRLDGLLLRLHGAKTCRPGRRAEILRLFEQEAGSLVADVGRLVARLEGRE